MPLLQTPVYKTIITIQGLETLNTHWHAVAAMTEDLTEQVVINSGQLTTALAREIYKSWPHKSDPRGIPTLDTIRMEGQTPATGYWGSGDPTVFKDSLGMHVNVLAEGGRDPDKFTAAMALEFGFVHHATGNFIQPRPFLIPALDAMTPAFVNAMMQVGLIADKFPKITGPNKSGVERVISSWRHMLYTTAKFLGDIQVIAPSPWIGGTRSMMYATARGLGDLNAGLQGALLGRAASRAAGRITGRGIAASRFGFSLPQFGGVAYQRLYNRIIGKEIGRIGLSRFG